MAPTSLVDEIATFSRELGLGEVKPAVLKAAHHTTGPKCRCSRRRRSTSFTRLSRITCCFRAIASIAGFNSVSSICIKKAHLASSRRLNARLFLILFSFRTDKTFLDGINRINSIFTMRLCVSFLRSLQTFSHSSIAEE